jgi:hypothetical protein
VRGGVEVNQNDRSESDLAPGKDKEFKGDAASIGSARSGVSRPLRLPHNGCYVYFGGSG